MTAVTPTDRPKSVRYGCVMEVFGGVFYVVTLLFGFFCWLGAFVQVHLPPMKILYSSRYMPKFWPISTHYCLSSTAFKLHVKGKIKVPMDRIFEI